MKFFRNCIALSLLALGLQNCTPDTVNPKANNPEVQTSWEEDGPHTQPGVICGPTANLKLAQLGGNSVIDYCGSFNNTPLPCPANTADWGVGIAANMRTVDEEDIVSVDMTMTPTWFITNCVSKVADSESFNLDQNGVPIIDATWSESGFSPSLNRWAQVWNLGPHQSQQCVSFAAKITVSKLGFFASGPDPLSVRELWVYNENFNNLATPEMLSPSSFITPWCLHPCPGDVVTIDPKTRCQDFPEIPDVTCTESAPNGSIHINNASSVVCIPNNRNGGGINFNSPGTLVIEEGAIVSGGINANNGGNLIVKGTFNWNGNANINGNFKIYILENGTLIRSNDLTMNNQNNLLVNYGMLNIGSNLTYTGSVYNSGTVTTNGINVNSSNSKLINAGQITSNNFVNINNNTLLENCGTLKVGNNLEVNSGSSLINYCSIIVDNVTHINGTLEHHGTIVSGHSGSADGFSIQGQALLHDNSTILTRNFFWSANNALEVNGNATVLVSNATLNASNEVIALQGTGRLRMSGGSSLSGEGSLVIADIDPVSSGDNPTSPNVSFPEGLHSMVNIAESASLVLRSLDPQNDIPALCK